MHDTSIVITPDRFGHSQIRSLGRLDSVEVGIQLELLESHLGNKEIILNGIALFTRNKGAWKLYSNPVYRYSNYKTANKKLPISDTLHHSSSLTIEDITIDYNDAYYIMK